MSRLLVSVLGNQNSGKTHTWRMLFGRNVRTGTTSRELEIAPGQCVPVFLVSGSAEERRTTIETIMGSATPDIVLCSVQYLADAQNTFQFFLNRDYELVVHWLNPGYGDTEYQRDMLGLVEWLRHRRSEFEARAVMPLHASMNCAISSTVGPRSGAWFILVRDSGNKCFR
jgi:hypothetical protein